MGTRRCSICALNWPTGTDYNKCPKCAGDTSYINNEDSMTLAEAKRKKDEIDFEAHYAKRGPRQLIPEHQAAVNRAIARAEEQQALELLWQRSTHVLEVEDTS